MNFNQKITIAYLLTCFSCVSGMFSDLEHKFMEIRKHSNADLGEKELNEILYPKVKRFEDSLNLLNEYAQLIVSSKINVIRSFQMKALDNSIEYLSNILALSNISIPKDQTYEETNIPSDIDISKSLVVSLADSEGSISSDKDRRKTIIKAYKNKILEFRRLMNLISVEKEGIKIFFEESSEETQEKFLSDIINGINALRSIVTLIDNDKNPLSSNIMNKDNQDFSSEDSPRGSDSEMEDITLNPDSLLDLDDL